MKSYSMKANFKFFIGAVILFTVVLVAAQDRTSTFTDSRDNKAYRMVTIGSQTWMAENLNYATTSGAWCYNNKTSNCDIYGRLYDWNTAMGFESSCNTSSCASQIQSNHQGICPSGWRLPSDNDWSELMTAVGGLSTAARHLKSETGWYECGPEGSGNAYRCDDTHGFSALPGGGRWDGPYRGVGGWGYWWSATESGATLARFRGMDFINEYVFWLGNDKSYGFSVRCVKD